MISLILKNYIIPQHRIIGAYWEEMNVITGYVGDIVVDLEEGKQYVIPYTLKEKELYEKDIKRLKEFLVEN